MNISWNYVARKDIQLKKHPEAFNWRKEYINGIGLYSHKKVPDMKHASVRGCHQEKDILVSNLDCIYFYSKASAANDDYNNS